MLVPPVAGTEDHAVHAALPMFQNLSARDDRFVSGQLKAGSNSLFQLGPFFRLPLFFVSFCAGFERSGYQGFLFCFAFAFETFRLSVLETYTIGVRF
jgi:hypothetical protein